MTILKEIKNMIDILGDTKMVDWLALIVAIFALVLSAFQFIRDSSRQKKEATLDAYSELQHDVFDNINKYDKPINVERGTEEWNTITDYLARIERFSVGINTGIYSICILNRLAGSFYIHEYDKLLPIIQKKRNDDIIHGGHYDEFESTVKKLKEYRKCKNCIEKSLIRIKWFLANYKLD